MSTREIVTLTRDVVALMVPSGARIMLYKDTDVTIMQSLGSTYTVSVFGNLARIEGKDADALGREPEDPLQDLPEDASIEDKVWAQLKTVFDPEIPVNIVDLGLVYDCDITPLGKGEFQVKLTMTLTAPGCGMGPVIADDAKRSVESIPEVNQVVAEIVFEPLWNREMISDEAKLQLGLL